MGDENTKHAVAVAAGGIASAEAFGTVEVKLRSYLSSHHLWSARHFARLALEIESSAPKGISMGQRSYVMGAVLSSAAFVEAAINELLMDCVEAQPNAQALPIDAREMLAGFAEHIERAQPTEKYQLALSLCRKPRMNRGAAPFDQAVLLFQLRNMLMHFRPETLGEKTAHKLSDALRPRFKPNVLMQGFGNPFFPDHCLGSGCAEWAVATAIGLTDAFFAAIGVKSNYQVADLRSAP